jgi:hypothetical protein
MAPIFIGNLSVVSSKQSYIKLSWLSNQGASQNRLITQSLD